MMAKAKTVYFCQSCGAESAKWVGKCPSCGAWNTYAEEVVSKAAPNVDFISEKSKPINIKETVSGSEYERIPSGIAELDRVLGGGCRIIGAC